MAEVFKEIFAFIGMLTVLVAVLGIILNEVLYGNWYGETEEQRRERIRKERAARGRIATQARTAPAGRGPAADRAGGVFGTGNPSSTEAQAMPLAASAAPRNDRTGRADCPRYGGTGRVRTGTDRRQG